MMGNFETVNEDEILDLDTGEVKDVNSGESHDQDFYKLFEEGLEALNEVGGGKLKLLLYLVSNMNKNNVVSRKQSQMAKNTGLSAGYISKTLNEFESRGIAVIGRNNYMINPDVIFKGKAELRLKALYNYYKQKERKLYKPKPE